MKTILNWNNKPIEVACSRGGTLAVINPSDNLVVTGMSLWPCPEITQKLYQSRQVRAYDPPDLQAVTQVLGFYSDLQSLHSEDAITWSVFGTLAYAQQAAQCRFVKALLESLEIPTTVSACSISIWRRIPHPDTLVSGGPEIDFAIYTDRVIVFGEAKWRSPVSQAQGKAKDKDQITLRAEFFEKHGKGIYPGFSHYVILGISPYGGVVSNGTRQLGGACLHFRDTAWQAVCDLAEHPLSDEVQRYLQWKVAYS